MERTQNCEQQNSKYYDEENYNVPEDTKTNSKYNFYIGKYVRVTAFQSPVRVI